MLAFVLEGLRDARNPFAGVCPMGRKSASRQKILIEMNEWLQ